MPYPSKTDRQSILTAAVKQLARDGLRGLSLRSLASSLDLAPNALYRYFADRAELEAAMTAESARQLHAVLHRAAGDRDPVDAIRSMALAYIRFARDHHHLYEMMMLPCAISRDDASVHEELWSFVVSQVARVAAAQRSREAAVALWAFLHGTTALEAAQVFGDEKPFSSFDFGLEAWLAAASGTNQKSTATERGNAGGTRRTLRKLGKTKSGTHV